MSGSEGRFARLREALYVVTSCAADLRSRLALVRCYRSILRSTTDPTEEHLRLRIHGRAFDFHMRRMDVFTVAEILHERQYELRTGLAPSPIVIDGGANIGVAALWFLARFPGATVHAFEPEPRNFELLRRNLAGVPGAHAVQAALGANEEPVLLHLAEHSAVHSVKDAAAGERTVEVPCVRLDRYLAEHGIAHVHLLKLDVEGSEADAVLGLGQRLADVDVIVGEMHERLVDADALYARLADAGLHLVQKQHFRDAEACGVHAFEVARRD